MSLQHKWEEQWISEEVCFNVRTHVVFVALFRSSVLLDSVRNALHTFYQVEPETCIEWLLIIWFCIPAYIHFYPWETLGDASKCNRTARETQVVDFKMLPELFGIGKPIVLGGLQGKQKSTLHIIDNQKVLHSSNG